MEVAAGGGGEVGVEVRWPEVVGDEVDDALFGLQGPGDAEEGGGLGQGGVPLKKHSARGRRSQSRSRPPGS